MLFSSYYKVLRLGFFLEAQRESQYLHVFHFFITETWPPLKKPLSLKIKATVVKLILSKLFWKYQQVSFQEWNMSKYLKSLHFRT
jgi:hypothetical protein